MRAKQKYAKDENIANPLDRHCVVTRDTFREKLRVIIHVISFLYQLREVVAI